jgi:hypothetical protein
MVGIHQLIGYSTMHEVSESTSIQSKTADFVNYLFPTRSSGSPLQENPPSPSPSLSQPRCDVYSESCEDITICKYELEEEMKAYSRRREREEQVANSTLGARTVTSYTHLGAV